jgi:subtilisin family serine protease
MKPTLIFAAIIISFCSHAQKIYVDSTTGSKIKGAVYVRVINKYLVTSDSSSLRKKYKSARIRKDSTLKVKLFFNPDAPVINNNTADKAYAKAFTEFVKTVKKGFTGHGVKLAILDTGVDTALVHYNYMSEYITNDITGVRGKHGTMVGSIVKSPIGVAPGVEIHYLKIWNTDIHGNATSFTSESNYILALDYCYSNNIDIINISASLSQSTLVSQAMDNLFANNCIIVAATGNDGTDNAMAYPAAYSKVVPVNSLFLNGASHASVLGLKPVGCAVGGGEQELVDPNQPAVTIGYGGGTSLSTPFFAGLLACKLEEHRKFRYENYRILQHVINQCYGSNMYTGNGRPTF